MDDINKLNKRIDTLIADIRRLDELKDIANEMQQKDRDEIEKIEEQIEKLKTRIIQS